jgi:hypothetical protein
MARLLSNWLHAYAEYTEGTESPETYHLWVALGTIAAAAQRKIGLRLGLMHVHSNMFITLVGPAGGPRKSTALNIGKNLIVGTAEYGAKIELAPKKASSAAIVSRMARINNPDHQSITAIASELGTLLGSNNAEVSDLLTDLWDCDPNFDKETVGRGAEKITAPWVNIMAGTTPIWLSDNLPKTASEGGFVSRGIFVYAEDTKHWVPRPSLTPEQEELGKLLAHDLAEIALLSGNFTFSESAGEYYDEWYLDRRNFSTKYNNRMTTYYARKHIHVLKVAMAVSLANSDQLILEPRDIAVAVDIVEEVEKQMSVAFQGVGRNILGMDHERIKKQIQKAGPDGMTYRDLLITNIQALDKQQLDSIIAALAQMGVVAAQGKVGPSLRLFAVR